MRHIIVRAALAAVLAGGAALAFASAAGPPSAHTGAPAVGGVPAEPLCTACHGTFPANLPDGQLEILDLPAMYVPGATYLIRVRLNSTATQLNPERKWGFELTALRAVDGLGVGTFTVPPELQNSPGFGAYESRRYVGHTVSATRTGQAGPVEWQLSWTAPPTSVATVYFYAAGNAANGDGQSMADHIYTAADTVLPGATVARPGAWGAIKARFR